MDTIKVSYNDLINYLNDMYRTEGTSPDFMQYIDRLLARGGDCYKILNAIEYHIPEEDLVKMDRITARKHADKLQYIDKDRFIKLLLTISNTPTDHAEIVGDNKVDVD